MTATLIQGEASGRIVRLYIQSGGTLSSPSWLEIVNREGDKSTPPKKTVITQETFAQRDRRLET